MSVAKGRRQFVMVDRPAALAGRPAGNIVEKAAFSCRVDSRQFGSIQHQAAAHLDGNSHMPRKYSTQEKPHAQQLGLFFQDHMHRVFAGHIFAAEIPERSHVNARE